jgi:hypothetical protein
VQKQCKRPSQTRQRQSPDTARLQTTQQPTAMVGVSDMTTNNSGVANNSNIKKKVSIQPFNPIKERDVGT